LQSGPPTRSQIHPTGGSESWNKGLLDLPGELDLGLQAFPAGSFLLKNIILNCQCNLLCDTVQNFQAPAAEASATHGFFTSSTPNISPFKFRGKPTNKRSSL